MKTQNINRLVYFICCICVAFGGIPTRVQAASEIWSATAANGAWETGANWVSGNAPGANTGTTSPDIATFKTGSTTLTVLPDAGRNIFGITFDTSAVGAYIIGAMNGNALLLSDGGSIQNTTAVNANQTLLAPLAFQGNYTFTANSTASSNGRILIFSNVVGTAASGVTNTLTLNGVNTGNNVIKGEIGDGAGGGNLFLVKSGTGTWVLSGTNTYSGGTTLNSGIFHLNNPYAIGTGMLTLNGGTLMNSKGGGVTLANSNAQTWSGDFAFAGKTTSADPKADWNLNLGTGPVTLTSNRMVTVTGYSVPGGDWAFRNATLTVGGVISDGGNGYSLTKAGPSSLSLTASNMFSGGVTLNAGTLSIGHNNAIGTGPLTINGGTIANSELRTLSNNNTHFWNGDFSASYAMNKGLNTGTGSVTLSTNITITMGAGSWGTSWTVPGVIGESGGSRSLTVKGGGADPGQLNLTGTNIYSGGTILESASIRIGNTQALGTGPLTIKGGSISQTSGNALTGISGQTWSGNFTFQATAGAIDMGTSPVTLTGNTTNTLNNGSAVVGGIISGTGTSLTLKGTDYVGYFFLTGANTFEGGLTLIPGSANVYTLYINNPSAIGSGPFTINQGTGQTMRFDNSTAVAITLSNNNVQNWNAHFTYVGTRSLNMGTGAVTLGTNVTATVSANTLTIGGPIGDGAGVARSLTKAGLGTLVLSAANTYSGGTIVTNGTLTVESTGTLGNGNVFIGTNATLRLLTSTAISNTATVQLVTVGSKYGKADLTNDVIEVVSGVIIDGTLYDTPGTYGSTASGAKFPFDNQFTGAGMLRILANPGTIISFQ